MFIVFGVDRSSKDFGSAGEHICQRCNNKVDMHKVRVTTWFTIFFIIKLIPLKREYVVQCPICNNTTLMNKEEFENDLYTSEEDKYAGKTEVQIAFLKQMEEIKKSEELNNKEN